MISSLPLIMVMSFLIFTLIVGLYYSRKTTTLKEYAIGHKNFTTATLVATVLSTTLGGGTLINNIQEVHCEGLHWLILALVSTWLGLLTLSALSTRMTHFMKNLSMAETIGQVYGKLPRIITALSSMSCSITSLAIQVNVITQAISICIDGVNPTILAVIATLILIFYSTFGGIRAVTITDVLQCITFVLIIPCLAWLMFRKVNQPFTDVFLALSSFEKFQFSHVFQWNKQSIKMLFIGLTSFIGCISPPVVQRIYMSSNVIQARKIFLLSSIFKLFIKGIILLVGLFIFIGAPHLLKSDIVNYIVVDLSPVFKGLLAISLLAMAMSTADSYLNAYSVMVTHDIIGPLRNNKISSTLQLQLARVISFVVGILSMLLTFYQKDLLALILLGNKFFIPIVTAPLLLAIFGFRSSSRTALIGMATGLLTILIWNKYLSDIEGSVPAMLANGVAMLGAHYSLPRKSHEGWEKPDLEYLQLKQAKQRQYYRLKQQFKSFLVNLISKKRNLTTTHVVLGALYILITSWMPLFNRNFINLNYLHLLYWPLVQSLVALSMLIYVITIKNYTTNKRNVWLLILMFCLSTDAIWHMYYVQDQRIALALSFCHLGVLCLLLPMHLVVSSLALLMTYVMTFRLHRFVILLIGHGEIFALGTFFITSLLYMQYIYLKKTKKAKFLISQKQTMQEQALQRANKVKYLDMLTTEAYSEADILTKISNEQAQFFSSLKPEEFKQSYVTDAMEKLIHFAEFFDERAKLAQGYLQLKLTKFNLYDLINQVETNLLTKLNYQPRLYVEPSMDLATPLIGDRNLLSQALEDIVIDLLDPNYIQSIQQQVVSIAFYNTQLQYKSSKIKAKSSNDIQKSYPSLAIRLYNNTTYPYSLPPIQTHYDETIAEQSINYPNSDQTPKKIKAEELSKHQIKSIIAAHYGYYIERFTLEHKDFQNFMAHQSHTSFMPKLVLLPQDSSVLRQDIVAHFPKDKRSAKEAKIMGDAIMELLEFQHFMVHVAKLNQAVLSSILYLIKKAYDVRQHDCGELLLKRAIAIAQEVATFTPDHNAIYAALLYEVPHYTGLPMSYIRAHYADPIANYVSELVAMSGISSPQKYKTAIEQNQTALICIKLTERWYDLIYAKGYKDKKKVKALAKESLAVDLPVARQFFSDVIGKNLAKQLEDAAKSALKLIYTDD